MRNFFPAQRYLRFRFLSTAACSLGLVGLPSCSSAVEKPTPTSTPTPTATKAPTPEEIRATERSETRAAERAADRELDRAWERYQKHEPNLGVRDLYGFILNAAERNWRPDVLPKVIALANSMQDRDPKSPTYGNYRWYWHDPKPDDRNAVEFSMQTVSLTWLLHRDKLTEESQKELTTAMTLGIEGMLRHKVDVSYTNIFLMRIANCALLGEAMDKPELVQHAREWFNEWFDYTRTNGVHEFASPTYYGVDLSDLGAIARYVKNPAIKAQAESALRFFWTEIAARWFEPYQGIAGAYSRDYGFLTGHGDLDQHLTRAGWNKLAAENSRPALETLTHWDPPADLREQLGAAPRTVAQKWGHQPWEIATTYVGKHFALGTAGEGYGQQDKMLALTLAGGPQQPIVNFAMDYRGDPYGQAKVVTGGGHLKLTHLVPFTTAVQRGPEALMIAAFDPADKSAPTAYSSLCSNIVFPLDVELWDTEAKISLPANSPLHPLDRDNILFIRYQDVAIALQVVTASNDRGAVPVVQVVRDGTAFKAQRLTVVNSPEKPQARVYTAIWIRAAEDLDDAKFAAFRRAFVAAAARSVIKVNPGRLEITVPSLVPETNLKLVVDLEKQQRVAIEGADPALKTGVLNINGKDVATALLGASSEAAATPPHDSK